MDHGRRDRNRNQICGNNNNRTSESEYDVVDDQEEVLKVRILPARPINEEREYADRDLPRSLSAQSLSSLSTGNSGIVPRPPPREISHIAVPAVNRDLKPGRRKILFDQRPIPVQLGAQRTRRCCPSPPLPTLDLVHHFTGLTLDKPCRRDELKTTEKAEVSSCAKGLQRAESITAPRANQRHSLDLETQIEIRSHQNLERVPSKRHHHEWPQTKEDFDQRDFVPKEKPKQMYCEEDWYIGSCNRVDAEHALHLVNKDGAFLVRDCSNNTNSEPLVLAVYHEKKVYNVKIRFNESTSKYALGTGQRSKDMFDSVADIIKFHTIFPIILISGRNAAGNKYPENCVLTCAVTRKDVDQLLQ